MKRLSSLVLILPGLLLTISTTIAQQSSTLSNPSVTAAELYNHIKYLASDALEGRGTGTKGGEAAAAYIRKEFVRYGLKPAGEDGSFFQTFEVVTGIELGGKNACILLAKNKRNTFKLRTDFIPLSFSENGTSEGEIVFAGYGITAPKLNHDDYANIDVKKKIVLVFTGHPEEDDPQSQFAALATLRSKALYAREAGASALLIVRSDTSTKELYALKYDNSPATAGLPCVNISQSAADAIFQTQGTSFLSVWKRLTSDGKVSPVNFQSCTMMVRTNVAKIIKKTSNVIGLVPGTDPVLKERIIVIGAHYDHLGWGQNGSLYRGKKSMIHNGADDNASGTAAILELSQYFAAGSRPSRRTLAFIAFTGEEMGLLGSGRFVSHPTFPLKNIETMMNIDMIGRMPDSTRELNVQGIGTSPSWKDMVDSINAKYSFALKMIDDGQGPSDHSSFYQKDIPVLFFFTGLHSDYHKPSDDYEKINAKNEEAITRFISDLVTSIDGKSATIAFTKVKRSEEERRARAFTVYVGTIPDFGSTEKGFKLSGVSEGSPAEKAGLKGGDIMIKFGDTNIQNIYDYMGALSLHKPGEDVPVTVKRGSEVIVLTVHLEKK